MNKLKDEIRKQVVEIDGIHSELWDKVTDELLELFKQTMLNDVIGEDDELDYVDKIAITGLAKLGYNKAKREIRARVLELVEDTK